MLRCKLKKAAGAAFFERSILKPGKYPLYLPCIQQICNFFI